MSELSIEQSLKKYTPLGATLFGVLALAGCAAGTSGSSTSVQGMNPSERFEHDYVETSYSNGGDNQEFGCLFDSPYDPETDNPPALSFDRETETLSVTPSQGPVLELSGFGQTKHIVAATNAQSKAILDAYGCVMAEYARQ